MSGIPLTGEAQLACRDCHQLCSGRKEAELRQKGKQEPGASARQASWGEVLLWSVGSCPYVLRMQSFLLGGEEQEPRAP